MNKQDFVKCMAYLGIAYNKEFNDEQIGIWYSFFKDIKKEIFVNAIKKLILSHKYLPSISEVNNEILLINKPELKLDPNEQWELVLTAIRRGILKTTYFETITKNVIHIMGINRLEEMQSSQIEWFRKEFIDLFLGKRENFYNNETTSLEMKKITSQLLKSAKD